jgi:hypothetical protein
MSNITNTPPLFTPLHTPLHPFTPYLHPYTPSHPFTPLHTPSHPIHTPSHTCTPLHTPSHSFTPLHPLSLSPPFARRYSLLIKFRNDAVATGMTLGFPPLSPSPFISRILQPIYSLHHPSLSTPPPPHAGTTPYALQESVKIKDKSLPNLVVFTPRDADATCVVSPQSFANFNATYTTLVVEDGATCTAQDQVTVITYPIT